VTSRPIEELWEEMRDKRLHPTWKDRLADIFYWPFYRLVKYHNPFRYCREVKWFLQRGKRGWADCDVWGLDDYLAGWLPDALKQLSEDTHGYPASLCDEENDPSGDAGFAEWREILAQIAEGFRAHKRMGCGLYEEQLGPYPLYRPEGVSKEAWQSVRDTRFEKSQELAKRDEVVFQRGMALFTAHWSSLWD
jgi:hypothetical protein